MPAGFSEDAIMQHLFSFEQMVTVLFMDYLAYDAMCNGAARYMELSLKKQ